MSSTRTEIDPRLPPPAWMRRLWSITGRLTLLYVGSTAVMLLLAGGYLHWGLTESLAREDRALVTGKFQVLRLLLSEHHEKSDVLVSEVEHEAAANELLKYYLRVLDGRGRVLLETEGMSSILPVMVFPAPGPLSVETPEIVQAKIGDDRTYLLLTGGAVTGADGDEERILQIGLDVEHNDEILADYRRNLVAVFCVGTAFAAVAGVFVTRTGLRPLQAITRQTQRITASKLDERVSASTWPAELRELASAFDAMLDRLQESFNRLSEFSADLAHALRNPINNLRGEAEVALTRARTSDEYRQTLTSGLEELERLSRLTEGLLFIARADDPRTAVERGCFDVRREMNAVQEFYEALAAEREVRVTCEGEAEIRGDPTLVRRAISNLLANALKHTPAGGGVTLRTRRMADGGAEISVVDTGRGIRGEHLPRVFDRFFQVDKTRDSTANGAGLGLAIVRSIMQLHGGEASIDSKLGKGTTVTLRFPG